MGHFLSWKLVVSSIGLQTKFLGLGGHYWGIIVTRILVEASRNCGLYLLQILRPSTIVRENALFLV